MQIRDRHTAVPTNYAIRPMIVDEWLRDRLQTENITLLLQLECDPPARAGIYQTDHSKVLIRTDTTNGSDILFQGVFESLKAIYNTRRIRVPQPLVMGRTAVKNLLILEHMDASPVHSYAAMGEKLAMLHLSNMIPDNGFVGTQQPKVEEFGFHVKTFCGTVPQDNEWCSDWVLFFARKLDVQIKKIQDVDLHERWLLLQLKIPSLFHGLDIRPSLLHGNLWNGNAASVGKEVCIYNPVSFYGHHEFDLAASEVAGLMPPEFYMRYHEWIPQDYNFDKRSVLYQLFHFLILWRQYGAIYKNNCLRRMDYLILH